jgi:ABC-type dipeptide/oligopeptide/nickel transport system permease subunit
MPRMSSVERAGVLKFWPVMRILRITVIGFNLLGDGLRDRAALGDHASPFRPLR